MQANKEMTCPQCETALDYVTTLQTIENNIWREVFDVGRCDTCGRQFFRAQSSNEYNPLPWAPQCRICGDTTHGVAADSEGGMYYACRRHPHERFRWRLPADRWERVISAP